MAAGTEQVEEREAGAAIRDGAAVVVAVLVAALLLASVERAMPPSAWHDPLLWSVSGAIAVAAQATLWVRSRRTLAPVGALLLLGAAYATNTYGANQWDFLAETPLAWVTGVVCLTTGLAWHVRSS